MYKQDTSPKIPQDNNEIIEKLNYVYKNIYSLLTKGYKGYKECPLHDRLRKGCPICWELEVKEARSVAHTSNKYGYCVDEDMSDEEIVEWYRWGESHQFC